ncbi:chromosome segregation protein SMC [Metabacillus malikii]|uniref:Chromosome partition protein Smc n=1 Tax=Metabacillus malikii TaxID=1504265 RepID=A0ABT9ZEY8_9BACI|nr:chromosome segregation protein SMC [Metabacillus malikii]MDQ0230565.1 chromosome segregation protein [Metabacillus malikii]
MFLKRLDIVGFKSFAERVTVDFDKGVTAVVGPNGSGKSNITDGIRWVLGEQSAKSLRGTKMEDIIFAGSDSRKGLNVAEVTLTLDNEDHFLPIDYQEVSVTRRVYRSGESEFYINKQNCRLKDIIDLFMDSGLGKEAFSIISQGKVEEILSSKAEERRSIFEEAAGVLKYKTRKKKAEYKLAETQENLNRVEDILHELESQVEPLKIQASIAKDYLEQKEELENIEVALTVYEIEELHEKYENLANSVEESNDQVLQLTTSIQKKEAHVEKIREHIIALDDSINDLQQVLLFASEELEKLEGRKEVLKERKKNAHQNKEQLEKSIKELSARQNDLLQEKKVQESLFDSSKQELKEMKQVLEEKQKLMATYNQNIAEMIEDLKNDYFDLLNEQAAARNELQYIEEQLGQQEIKKSRLLETNKRYVTEREQIANQSEKIKERYSQLEKQLSEQIKNFRDSQAKLENLKNAYQKKESTLYQAYQILQQTRSRKEVLESMQEDYAGFFQGVKEILKASDRLEGIHGAVAELITTDKQYETAIEIALSSSLQHVVVENELAARNAIQYLKQHSFGRATFLPLSVMKERLLNAHDLRMIESHPAFVGVAKNLVNYNVKYKMIIGNLLGTVIVTSDLKGANEIAKLMNYRYRLVTLSGDVVNPGGSMTGGAVKQKNNSLLSRSRELETINEKLAEMEEKTIKLENDVKATKTAITEHEQRLEVLRSEGEKLRIDEQQVRSEMREIELNEKNINDHLKLYDEERMSFETDKERFQTRINELNRKLVTLAEKLARLDEDISAMSKKKETEQLSKEELQNELTDLKVILASKQQVYENQQEKLERINQELDQVSQKYKDVKDDYSLLSSEMDTSSSGEEKLEEAAKKKLQDKTKTIELIASRREERLQLQTNLDDEERELKELKRREKQFHDSLKDEEVKLNRLDVELDNRLNHLREEYMLTFEAAKEQYKLEVEITEAKKRVKLIKLAIEELGTVNLGAIDEFERVYERYTFLTEQRDDLTQAKDTLYQVIDEMDDEMKKRFQETFYEISAQFQPVFQALFGGGRAELKLTDPSDLLNTGVEIVAQPPGKKLQNLGLLSGGERALTAIALLFSIIKVRPVPFCVLDEVEAALDEANVYRFAQYLKSFSHETQFIVITHRKGTMEEADVLYGVTMQESGVSKLVSVRLEETNELVQSS